MKLPTFLAAERQLQALEGHPNSLIAKWPGVVRVLMNALGTSTWTDDDEACLAGLRQEAVRYRLFEADDTAAPPLKVQARAVTAMLLALGDSSRLEARSDSPWPEDRPGAGEIAAVVASVETALALVAEADGVDPGMARITGLLHVHCVMLLVGLATISGKTPDLLARISAHADLIPGYLTRMAPAASDVKTGARLYTSQISPSDEAVLAMADHHRGFWDSAGADYARAETAATKADASGDPRRIRAAIAELEIVWLGLPAGSPLRGRTLTLLADMRLALAASTNDLPSLADVIAIAITAIRMIPDPRTAQAASSILVDCLAMQAATGRFQGPFAQAAEEARLALTRLDPADPAHLTGRAALLTVVAAATGMRAAASDDTSLRRAAREMAEEAEGLLPAIAPSATLRHGEWMLHYRTAVSLHRWTMTQVLAGGDGEMLPVALRAVEKLDGCLADGAGTARETRDARQARRALLAARRRIRAGKPPVPDWRRARLAAGQPEIAGGQFPGPFADLREALAAQVDGVAERSAAHRAIGVRLADLLLADPATGADEVLRDAVAHLTQALVTGEFTLPTAERAALLDLLARCYHESGRRADDARLRHRAERVARAALRELAGCVLIAPGMDDALAAASTAGEICARAANWCLADRRYRAAVDLAEAGRGLRLASVVMTGRAEALLRAAGRVADADAWGSEDEAGRARAVEALWDTPGGTRLLTVPSVTEVSASMFGSALDAIVYLMPPDDVPGGLAGHGHAVLVRPVTDEVEVVPLPRLAAIRRTPLAEYLAALEGAVTSVSPGVDSAEGFRGGPEGHTWATALDTLGQWTHDAIMAPLIAHARDWELDDLPRLALIPLGQLAAIPFAAAWTLTAPDGPRRYTIEDVVLSYAASARLLGEVISRPRQPTGERVVFVTDPLGDLHFSRRPMARLAGRLYPGAAVYGVTAPDGPATAAVMLGALPGPSRPGASLLHLTTHGTLDPVPALVASDRQLPLADILDQARGRARDAPGGLVITSACLTDATRASHDESLTLATAFLAAGATTVIGTRWPVDNDTTTALAIRFHHHLNEGGSPAEALRQAQRDLLHPDAALRASLGPGFAGIADSRLSHPASWAGFVHHGI